MIWWLGLFVFLTLVFRALFGAAAAAERHYLRHVTLDLLPSPVPTNVADFLTWPEPLCADGVEVTDGGGPCLVLNQAAAELRCHGVELTALVRGACSP